MSHLFDYKLQKMRLINNFNDTEAQSIRKRKYLKSSKQKIPNSQSEGKRARKGEESREPLQGVIRNKETPEFNLFSLSKTTLENKKKDPYFLRR
jgi:hypothetical protein